MENLRRVTIYAERDRQVAAELLNAVMWRALNGASKGGWDPLPWFDAGYLIESYKQGEQALRGEPIERALTHSNEDEVPDGYRLVVKALQLAGSSPEMEFAASLS